MDRSVAHVVRTDVPPDLWRSAVSEHRAVLKSIVAHDARAARTAMQRHLNQAYKRFSKGWNARTS